MSDAVWQLDAENSYAAVGFPAYRWTNVYYWLQEDFLNFPDPASRNAVNGIWADTTSRLTSRVGYRVRKLVPDGYDATVRIEALGNVITTGTPMLYTAVSMWLLNGNRFVGYKRYRGPWGSSALGLEGWSPSFLGTFEVAWSIRLGLYRPCNYHGVPITGTEGRERLTPLQLRHGTKRRARPVLP